MNAEATRIEGTITVPPEGTYTVSLPMHSIDTKNKDHIPDLSLNPRDPEAKPRITLLTRGAAIIEVDNPYIHEAIIDWTAEWRDKQ